MAANPTVDTFALSDGTLPTRATTLNADDAKWAATLAAITPDAVKSYTVPDGTSPKAVLRHLRHGARANGLKVRATITGQRIDFKVTAVKPAAS